MITNKELLDKYNTGRVYISPAAVEYPDGRIRTHYYCSGTAKEVLRDLMSHLLFPPTERCYKLPKVEYGVLRPGNWEMTDKEMEWLWVEYKLRIALLEGRSNKKVNFVVMGD